MTNLVVKVKRNKIFWHYVLKSPNGKILSTSETYYSKGNALRAAYKLASVLKIDVVGEHQ